MVKKIILGLIKLYQKTISPDHGFLFSHFYPYGCCRFYPTCSRYGYTAIDRFGVCVGSWMAFKRILRCNPLSSGGVDEVPKKR
ncbi:MAG: hypothetical protein ACD_63C00081G0005 [uncultured bacterium]|nr:MAG: hypothetical protein ACD_63C00081G0005 [uncultured bacterium]